MESLINMRPNLVHWAQKKKNKKNKNNNNDQLQFNNQRLRVNIWAMAYDRRIGITVN